ncbi:hypothetical protein B0H15DRAFT_975630, partial [Mycena belliarum]
PVRRSSPLAIQSTPSNRRRVQSVNPSSSAGYSRSRRTVSTGFASSQREGMSSGMSLGMSSVLEDSGISLFSDEYDLYPRILQDVQRALKLKARREARLKSANSSPSSAKAESATSGLKTSPSRPALPPIPFPPPPIPSTREMDPGPSSERASVGVTNHPIPTSLDEGTTLDWSGFGSDDDRLERRWSISISKRKDREKHPSNSTVETRQSMYAAKLLQIKTKASPRALEKASTACDQLGRRYHLIYNSLSSPTGFNISKVARWFNSQEDVVQASLEHAEPFTWLRDSGKTPKAKERLPWYLSALIMEEYLLQLRGSSNPQVHHRIALNSSPIISFSSRPQFPSSQGSSYYSLGPSLARKTSYEGRFEPLGELGRRSMDRDSRKSGESGYSSIFSGSSLPHQLVSPTSSHFQLRVGSDNGGSSRNSLSEYSDDGGRRKRPIVPPAPRKRDSLPVPALRAVVPNLKPLASISDDSNLQADKPDGPPSSVGKSSLDIPPTATGRNFGQRKVLESLPSGESLRRLIEERRQQDADEDHAEREYELKKQLLDATITQNNRVRQLLNRIAVGVREYDEAQTSLSASLNVDHKRLPRELVDAFSHDPAAVTGATRKYQSWRAVDDIHDRLARQRETFREYLAHSSHADSSQASAKSILADPISALMESLKTLDEQRREIAWRATEVSAVLKTVQTVHADVKAAYNGTLSHTSVIYPEISSIIAMEERYKDQYQYFWEIAMDALTFLLDTVTPFWRTYGKTIGDDVQHFLIIPLYRNEFTGQPKRYTINKLPQRSLRHWICLFLFFIGSMLLTFLQGRAAVSSVTHFWLSDIPFSYLRFPMLIPFWISIVIQWWAVVAELCIVFTQIAVVVWWAGWYINIFT